MTQTWAIFVDAYRSLNAKKMFWVVLLISLLVVGGFAAVGFNERGLKILVWQFDTEVNSRTISPSLFFKYLFVKAGIGIWLGWIASILALISTAGIFPDLLAGGEIDLLVSKPLSRLRLFLTEYIAGLLFVTLQVTLFTLTSFLVIGVRGGAWEPGLFMAIPLVVCFFSYLFSVCVLLGVITRSTLASLLLTLLFWFGVYAIGATENTLLMFEHAPPRFGPEARAGEVSISEPPPRAGTAPPGPAGAIDAAAEPRPSVPDDETAARASEGLKTAHEIFYRLKTFLPKTTETVGLLERTLIDMAELPDGAPGQRSRPDQAEAARYLVETLRERSVAWVVGTSLGFEAMVLLLAAWLFCRRDF